MAYIFYDTETTGLETGFDQILQFAAIKTDENLNELEQFDIRCQLLPHIVPAPGALLTTKIPLAMLSDPSLPTHYEAMRKVCAQLQKWSPATFIGYNSISFDEELLRQSFFQTLHPTYLTNTNRNSRGDVMRMLHAASVYAPTAIKIPVDEKGQQTFRLPLIAPANGYVHDDAHEALADVKMTMQMARLLRERAPEVWTSMMTSTKKSAVFDRCEKERTFSVTERYGKNMSHYLVTVCGRNGNADVAVFDLHYDPNDYISLDVDGLVAVLNGSPKVIRALRANAQPIIMSENLAPEKCKALKVPAEERQKRIAAIHVNKEFQTRVGEAMARRYEDAEQKPHLEQRIYSGGFPQQPDEARMQAFHGGDWNGRAKLSDEFEDERVCEFARRIIFFERPDLLPEKARDERKAWLKDRLLSSDEDAPWMTVQRAKNEIAERMKTTAGGQVGPLKEIEVYIEGIGARLAG